MTGFLSFASIFSSEFGSKTMRLRPERRQWPEPSG